MVVDNLGTIFLALSDPTRRAIIERLSQGPATVNELAAPFDISQQMISKHIAYLIRADIVVKTKHGRESICQLQPEAIKLVSDWTHEFSNTWDDTANGQPMNIYADLLSESEYELMKQRHQKAKGLVDAVFAG